MISSDRLVKFLKRFSFIRLGSYEQGFISLKEATLLIDAKADGMIQVLEELNQWEAIRDIELARA